MAIILSPRIYSSDLEWSLLPKNKIDTVIMSPLVNETESNIIDTQEITSGTTPSGVAISLPLSDNVTTLTKGKYMYNIRKGYTLGQLTWVDTLGTAAVYLTTISGSYTVHLSEPPANTPVATWSLEGTTEYIERGTETVEDVNTYISVNQVAAFIAERKVGTENIVDNKSTDNYNRANLKSGLLVDYNQGWVPIFPWVRDTTGSVPSGMIVANYLTSKYRPAEEDVFTTWNNDTSGDDWLPQYSDWNTYNTTGAVKQGPYRWLASASSDNFSDRFIPIVNTKYYFKCEVTKLSDYDFRVDYDLPARYIYMAGAKAVGSWIHTNEKGRDTYAFKDVISKITIQLQASNFTDDANDISYSLSGDSLTTDAVNEHILTFDKNELITEQTTWSGELWTEKMSTEILEKFVDGKFLVKCKVPATWAIQNGVTINTQMQILLQNGQYITRGSEICTFEVKNIEKRFQSSNFIFVLQLMEV